MTDVVVVGGGIAGLVCARRLALGGIGVTLLEASDRLGGSVARHVVGGIDLDAGAESFATRGGSVERLARELGLGDELVSPLDRGAWLYRPSGPAIPLPERSLLGIPGSPLAKDVVAVLGRGAAFRAFADAFLPGAYGASSTTLAELVRKRMGQAVVENLVGPVVRGVYSTSPGDLEVDRVTPDLCAAMRRTGSLARAVHQRASPGRPGSAVGGIRGGMFRLVEELTEDLQRLGVDVRLEAEVDTVEAGQVTVDGEGLSGKVVVASPAIPGQPASTGRRVVLATLVVDEHELDAAPRGTGVLVAEGDHGIRARALTHATAKWPWLAERTEGAHVLRLSYDDEPDDLPEIVRSDASALLGVSIARERVVGFATVEWFRWPRDEHASAGISRVGEAVAGAGLAGIIAHAEAETQSVLGEIVS